MLRSTTPEFQSLDSFATDEFEERDPFTVSIDNADFTHNSTMPNKNGDMQPIAKEFRQHYERKLMEICDQNNPECVQAKMKLQEDWIQDLTEQNDMLIKAVFDLEAEATERVKMLEGKLKESAACACEVMNNWRGRVIADKELNQTPPQVEQLESDVRNLLKVLRRSRNLTNTCALTEGLRFYNVNAEELAEILESDLNSNDSIVENIKSYSEAKIQQVSVNGEDGGNQKLRVCLEILEAHAAAMAKDRKIDQLQMNLSLNGNNRFEESDQFRLMQENYSVLKQTMQDMRDALTAEVADKHDAIVTLRRDVQLLEEQCKRADQQTHFKDDIIKELRKELKHSKQEGSCTKDCPARRRVAVLEAENRSYKAAIKQAQKELEQLENKTENYLDEEGENFSRHLQDLQVNVFPAVTLCEAQLDPLEIHNIFIGSKPFIGSKSTSKKSSTYELEDVINNLSESVSQMMMRNATNKSCNKRIQDLENQLAESMKSKDLDIDEERNRRNVEINNLIRTIQEQEDTLQSLQNQSKNLTDCVNFYLNSVKILQESEGKHKAQVIQQKVTINNLQEALMKVKSQLEELQVQCSFSAPEVSRESWATRWLSFGFASSSSAHAPAHAHTSISANYNKRKSNRDSVHDI